MRKIASVAIAFYGRSKAKYFECNSYTKIIHFNARTRQICRLIAWFQRAQKSLARENENISRREYFAANVDSNGTFSLHFRFRNDAQCDLTRKAHAM